MDIFLYIKGILVKDEIFNFVFSVFNNTQNLRLKFIDDAFAGLHYCYGLIPEAVSLLKSNNY